MGYFDFTCLTNRLSDESLAEGWMHVCPLGEHPWTSADGKETIIQVIDEEAVRLMAASYPLSEEDSMIDWEHKSMGGTEDTDAAGWGKVAEVRSNGLWVKVEWSDTGKAAVKGKRYKFNSPCFPRAGLVDLGGGRFRPTQLSRIALTNNPNLRGQDPLANSLNPEANPNPKPTHKDMDYKAKLLAILGLPPEATDEQIATALEALGEKPKDQITTLNSQVKDLQGQLANGILDRYGVTDAKQRALFAPLLTNSATKPDAEASLALIQKGNSKPADRPAIHNGGGAHVPNTDRELSGAAGEEDEEEKKKAAWIGNRASELRSANPNRQHRDCFSQAESEYARK